MNNEGDQRRLSAILAADVVGYTRLMEQDTEGTVAAWKIARSDIIDPTISGHSGRIVKHTGDGFLAEFKTVQDAVKCAIAMQESLTSSPLDFRMGVNLGDIIDDGEDIHGEGVNIAARIEALAEPGGISISGSVYEQVLNRLDHQFEDIGEVEVKNVARPVRVFQIGVKEITPKGSRPQDRLSLDIPSIAVLPFNNMSPDSEQEFFADGIAEDIITALSKISQMRVIARNSTFAYKGRAIDLRQVASELGVRYVLEGSVRSGGNKLRITAQLIDAEDGSHLWAERYDRTVEDIFDIQDEINKEIVTALRVKLTDGEEALMWARGTNNIDAWQFAVRASELFLRFSPSGYLEAREMAEKALALDPNYAHACATMGFTYWWDGRLGYTGDSEAKFARANEYAEQAMALDDTVSWAIGVSTMVAASLHRHEQGITIVRRGIKLNPGNAELRAFLAFALTMAGHDQESLDHYHTAMTLNPFSPVWYRGGLARSLTMLSKYDEALALFEEIQTDNPDYLQGPLFRAYIHNQMGRKGDAEQAIKEVRQIAPNFRLSDLSGMLASKDEAVVQKICDGIRDFGLPE